MLDIHLAIRARMMGSIGWSAASLAKTDKELELEADLNLTSLDRVELMSTLEEKFHVELDETSFSKAKTVADIQTLLRQPVTEQGGV